MKPHAERTPEDYQQAAEDALEVAKQLRAEADPRSELWLPRPPSRPSRRTGSNAVLAPTDSVATLPR
jgi:hypothetical protein